MKKSKSLFEALTALKAGETDIQKEKGNRN